MRFVIVGAGAVGGTIGARLHEAGEQVVLVARGAHAEAIARDGLDFRTPHGRAVLRIPVVSGAEQLALHDDDVLILATKTQDTLPLLQSLAAATTTGGSPGSSLPVVCAQNGVENERLSARRFDRVYGICVVLPASRLEPGVVIASGTPHSGLLDVGRWPRGTDEISGAVSAALVRAGFVSGDEQDIMTWKYAKLLGNLGNAVEALTGSSPGRVMQPVRAEAEQVLTAAGIAFASREEFAQRRDTLVELGEVDGETRAGGSSWQSLTLGAGSIEADYLNGEIVYLATGLGRRAPVNALLQRLANTAAASGASPGDLSETELQELLAQAAGG